jgi:uncharacterized protein YggE
MKHLIICVCLGCGLLFTASAQEKTMTPKTISVTGTAEEQVVPDEIYVQVDLREYDKRGVGKVDIETIKSNFLTACKSIGLGDSEVSLNGFEGNNYWQYKRSRKHNPDLKAGVSYWVKVTNVQKLDELVDKLDDEATENFTIAKTAYIKETELKKQLKIEAIKAAKAKADYLSAAIDEHIGGAITITDENETVDNVYPQTQYFANSANIAFKKASIEDEASTNVGFKKIKFQFQVNVVFALK